MILRRNNLQFCEIKIWKEEIKNEINIENNELNILLDNLSKERDCEKESDFFKNQNI